MRRITFAIIVLGCAAEGRAIRHTVKTIVELIMGELREVVFGHDG